jgi:hypothetical protein
MPAAVCERRTRLALPSCRAITNTMQSNRDAAAAGFIIVTTAALCTAAGAGIGALVGAPLPLAVVGVFFGLGFRLVYTRFRDI